MKAFKEELFYEEITKKRKIAHEVNAVDDKKLSATERAFHNTFNPERLVRCDFEPLVDIK